MKAIMTEQGLLIPKEEIARWGELVVEEKSYQLIIRPKSVRFADPSQAQERLRLTVTQLTYGILKGNPKWLEQIIEDVETGGATIDYGEPSTGLHVE